MRSVALTLVVTAHRVEHLYQAMESIAAQTSTHFDLICCADATGDGHVSKVFAKLSPRVPCQTARILTVRGGTAGRVRNAGFAASRTPWVAYLDGDDVLHRDAVTHLTPAILENRADIISTGMWRITLEGRPQELAASLTYRPPRWIYHTDPEDVGLPTYFNQLLAIRRDLWCSYPFYEDTNGEDIDFMLHHLLNGRFQKLPLALYGYRDTDGSFSKREYPEADLCTRRYRVGYYARLFAERYRTEFANNFTSDAGPR